MVWEWLEGIVCRCLREVRISRPWTMMGTSTGLERREEMAACSFARSGELGA